MHERPEAEEELVQCLPVSIGGVPWDEHIRRVQVSDDIPPEAAGERVREFARNVDRKFHERFRQEFLKSD